MHRFAIFFYTRKKINSKLMYMLYCLKHDIFINHIHCLEVYYILKKNIFINWLIKLEFIETNKSA